MIGAGCGTPVEPAVCPKIDSRRGPACPILLTSTAVLPIRQATVSFVSELLSTKTSFHNELWSLRRQMIEQARGSSAWWRSARCSQRVRSR